MCSRGLWLGVLRVFRERVYAVGEDILLSEQTLRVRAEVVAVPLMPRGPGTGRVTRWHIRKCRF